MSGFRSGVRSYEHLGGMSARAPAASCLIGREFQFMGDWR